jgi:hypothetical protein
MTRRIKDDNRICLIIIYSVYKEESFRIVLGNAIKTFVIIESLNKIH